MGRGGITALAFCLRACRQSDCCGCRDEDGGCSKMKILTAACCPEDEDGCDCCERTE